MKALLYIPLIFFAILITIPAWAGIATLSWDLPTTNADGTPLTDLAGYKIHHGTSPGSYTALDVGNVTQYTIDNLMDGQTHYFAVTAYDTFGNESGFSNEVSKLIGATTARGSSPAGGGGGCGMVRTVSGRPGPSPGQVVLNMALLVLLLSLGKMQALLKRRKILYDTGLQECSLRWNTWYTGKFQMKNNSSKYLPLCSIPFLITLLVGSASAATYYVDNTASGSNNGTSWQNAWTSFAAINWNAVNPGDTVYISGGSTSKTYYETLTVSDSGTDGNPITIKVGQDSGHNGMVILDEQVVRTNCIYADDRNNITISGEVNGQIRLRCTNSTQTGVMIFGPRNFIITYIDVTKAGTANNHHGVRFGLGLQGGGGNEISYSTIHDNYQDGVNYSIPQDGAYYLKIHHNDIYDVADDGIQGGGGVEIYNNKIHTLIFDKGAGHPDGIQAMGGYVKIYNNEIYDISNSCMFVDPINMSGQIAHEIYVYNNLLYMTQPQSNPIYSYTRGIEIIGDTPNPPDGLDNVYVFNNTIVDFGYKGISVGPGKIGSSGTLTNTRIENNLVYNTYKSSTSGVAISLDPGVYTTSDVIVDYNTVHEGNQGVSRLSWNGIGYSYDDFVSNGFGQSHGNHIKPTFVSYIQYDPSNNYRLSAQDTSSLNRGVNLSSFFTIDKDRNPRPLSSAWDIGAYQHKLTGPQPPVNLKLVQ